MHDPRTRRTGAGWFRDLCHGSTYLMDGERVFGPAPRDLDRYPVSIVGSRVVVSTGVYVCGYAPPNAACVTPQPY
jgi:Rieske Fe-S protein